MTRTLPPEKFEQMMRLAYIDDMPPTLNDDDDDSVNEVHEEVKCLHISLGMETMMTIMIIWLM